jgi:hypothetical protein
MRHGILRALGRGLVLAASLVLATPAAAFPDFDAKREQILLGRLRSSDPIVAGSADTHGTFDAVDGSLRRAATTREANAFWLAKGPAGTIGDGLVRFRLVPGKRPDVGLTFRAHVPKAAGVATWDLLCGYEVAVVKNKVRLLRWDRGIAQPLGDSVTIKGSPSSLEVVVHLVGPQLIATIYSGDRLELLATLAAHDTTYADGRVGLRAHAKTQGSALTLVSVMDIARAAKSGIGQRVPHGQLYGPDRNDVTPFGPKRYAFVPHDQLARLPAALRRRAAGEHTTAAGQRQAVLELSTVEAEQLRRTDVDVAAIDGTVGWGLLDAAYRERSGKPPTPTARGFRVDESYKDPAMLEALLRAYHERYPKITTLVELGRTAHERPIWGLKISDHPERAEDEPSVLFNGLHHASELLSTELALDVVQGLLEGYGRDAQVTGWVDDLEIWCVPIVNPDGNAYFIETSKWMIRKNARDGDGDGVVDPFEGVDLSRNYPFGWGGKGGDAAFTGTYFRGTHAGSEAETQAMMTLAAEQRFAASLSFHTIGRVIYVPYDRDGTLDPRPHAAWTIAEELAAAAPAQRGGKGYRVAGSAYPVAGSDVDWHMFTHGTVALLLEGAYHNPEPAIRTETVANTRPVWQALLERVARGPRISGHVRDEAGAPVEAEVTIAPIELRAGERWTSRPRDGRFDRLLVQAGKYTVRATAPGRSPASREVRVGARPVEVDLVLPLAR